MFIELTFEVKNLFVHICSHYVSFCLAFYWLKWPLNTFTPVGFSFCILNAVRPLSQELVAILAI